MGIIPIINENDTVAVEEIMLGDNDNLSAQITSLIEADLLIMLTDIDGLYNKDPRSNEDAELLSLIDRIGEEIENTAGDTFGKTTIGGMKTKIEAAKKAAAYGVPTIIANGNNRSTLEEIFDGKEIGSLFLPSEQSLSGRKHWIAFTLKSAGEIVIDAGAEKAITSSGKSLLPSGIKDVKGSFGIGESVTCVDENGKHVARGLTSYSSEDIKKIISHLKKRNIGILITDHNVQETLAITDRTYLMFEGNILKSGIPEDLAKDELVRKVYLGQNFEFRKKKLEY